MTRPPSRGGGGARLRLLTGPRPAGLRRNAMAKLRARHVEFLREAFGDRANFRPIEMRMYSHDIGAMPSLISPIIGDTSPEAVVQPQSLEELSKLARWASENGIPLTPRGKATSGYGGAIPVKNGVVVDFYRLGRVLAVDPEQCTAEVEAGAVWEKIDGELARHGLTLRLYPTSYPSATAGGWLAQGGAGIGSYRWGWFGENVESAMIVLPSGEVREVSAADLDVVSGACGITGLIYSLKIRVMKAEELAFRCAALPDAGSMQSLLTELADSDLPVWSVMFINPTMADLKNRSPIQEHYGHPVEERVILPVKYIVNLAFPADHAAEVAGWLDAAVNARAGEILPDRTALHEWHGRFKLMIVKRLGPSLVPAEVVIPLKGLSSVLAETGEKIRQPVIKEGIVIRKSPGSHQAVILGFIPADQRKFSFNFVFPLSLTLLKIAEEHGGQAYTTGFYFAGMADKILGAEKAAKIREWKRLHDPKGVFNPGKTVSNGLMSPAIAMARIFEPFARPIGNLIKTETSERPGEPVRGIPADVAWYAYSCSGCGYCIDPCDQFYGRGWESQTPRGKWFWLREFMEGRADWDQFMVDTFLVCTTCEICNLRCSAALPIEPSWLKLRGKLINEEKKMTFPPFEMMAAALKGQGNIWAGYRKSRSDWFPEDLKARHGPGVKAKNVYFAGCTASYVEKDIAQATVRLLDAAGVEFTYSGESENCCATPMLVAGKWDLFAEVMRKNIENAKASGADTVISSCPACDMMWRQVYPRWAEKLGIEYGLTAKHYSEVVGDRIKSGGFKFPEKGAGKEKVCFHDSCHIGRVSGVYEPPRDLIRAIPSAELVEMAHNRANGHCCGSVLTLIKEPEVAADIGKVRLDEAVEAGASKVLALCPCCEFQLRVAADKKKIPVEVVDLARYSAQALGFDFPDPNPEVKAQWAVFEAMIKFMTPQGFADLMATMWPELVDAMPFGMGPMMRFFGRIPGVLGLMKPMFPILFPILLPMMMPKVMPVMLARVKDRIPMPDYMAEQMPALMPGVMDNLMPHMIDEVVPLVTGPMIAFLRGKSK